MPPGEPVGHTTRVTQAWQVAIGWTVVVAISAAQRMISGYRLLR